MANYSCEKFSLMPYLLATVHPLQTDGWTDRQTDDNHDNSSTVT